MNKRAAGWQSGFTLIEVLVAISLLAIVMGLAYASLGQTILNAQTLSDRMDRLQSIQRTMRYLSTDLSSATRRPVRSELGDCCSAAVAISAANDYALAVTHGGWKNPAGMPRSTQQRSIYKLADGVLTRVYYNVLDATFANNAVATELLDGVESIEFRLLLDNGESTIEWPPAGSLNPNDQFQLPRAVEIILRLEDEGELRRIVEVAT